MSLAIEGAFAYIPNSGSNNVSNINESNDTIKAYEEAIEINPRIQKIGIAKELRY